MDNKCYIDEIVVNIIILIQSEFLFNIQWVGLGITCLAIRVIV